MKKDDIIVYNNELYIKKEIYNKDVLKVEDEIRKQNSEYGFIKRAIDKKEIDINRLISILESIKETLEDIDDVR